MDKHAQDVDETASMEEEAAHSQHLIDEAKAAAAELDLVDPESGDEPPGAMRAPASSD